MPGGCITDSTIASTALDSSLDAVKNGIAQGCALSYVDANTVQVSKCVLSVAGKFVKTSVTTNVTWGCSSCSSEVSSTQYYVYALITSSGTTLNLLISSSAPGSDGFDVSGNKIIGRFYNDSSSNIVQSSIYSWVVNGYNPAPPNQTQQTPWDSFSFSYGDTNAATDCVSTPCTFLSQSHAQVKNVGIAPSGNTYNVNFNRPYTKIFCVGNGNSNSNPIIFKPFVASGNTAVVINGYRPVDAATVANYGTVHCEGY